ncbi:MAG TPA: carbohydrate ABC transporter permease [Firmicutes bacterium]|nr:carbohydrate ABC transporter permease [Bacillota bacterium]
MKRKQVIGFILGVLRYLIIISVCYVILRPLLAKIVSSFMTEQDLYDQTVKWIPRNFTFNNYRAMYVHMKYFTALRNSLAFSFLIAVLQLASCTLVGYGLARFKFRGAKIIFGLAIFTLIVPPQIIILPLYLNFRFFSIPFVLPKPGIDLLNSIWPFILMAASGTGFNNGLFIYIMRQFFKNSPKSLEEAAYIDGANAMQTFIRVMLPGAMPALVIVFLFSFVWQYNDYFFTGMYWRQATLLSHTLDVAAENYAYSQGAHFTGQYISLLNNTGMILFILPLLTLFAFTQRYFIESVERTGLVG